MAECKECLHYDICEIMHDQYGISKIHPLQCGFYTPTADVAPKSEVDRLEGELIIETTRRKNAATAYNDAKSEVDKWMCRCKEWYEVAELKSQRILELEAELSKAKAEVARRFLRRLRKS